MKHAKGISFVNNASLNKKKYTKLLLLRNLFPQYINTTPPTVLMLELKQIFFWNP